MRTGKSTLVSFRGGDMELKYVQSVIDEIESQNTSMSIYDFKGHGRYPYTFAWDFVREHWLEFGFDGGMPSRAEVSDYFNTGFDSDHASIYEAAEKLAMAYYRKYYGGYGCL